MKLFMLVHEHRFGVSAYVFKSSTDRTEQIHAENYEYKENIQDILDHFGIDFEERMEEMITISEIENNNIPVIN